MPSSRRTPGSSDIAKPIDSGLRRHDETPPVHPYPIIHQENRTMPPPPQQPRPLPVRWLAPALAVLALGLSGCAGGLALGQSGEQALQQRAGVYWKALQDNDLLTAWKYEEASRDPKVSLQNYLQRGGGITYDQAQVQGVQVQPDGQASVQVQITYNVPAIRLKGEKTTLQDPWKLLDGQWYHVVRRAND